MDNQHRLITGYRELTPSDIDAINAVKKLGNDFGILIELLQQRPEIDKRWLAIGRTQLQQGIMAVVRSIAQPESF